MVKLYLLRSKITLDTYLLTFQYKILHRIYNCNYNLYVWKIKDNPTCDFCAGIDNLEHFFYYCPRSQAFWNQIVSWLSMSLHVEISLSVLGTLFGTTNVCNDQYYWLNFVILIGKYFISKCKKNEVDLCLTGFLKILKSKIAIEKLIYEKSDKNNLFQQRFVYFYNVLHQ